LPAEPLTPSNSQGTIVLKSGVPSVALFFWGLPKRCARKNR
jgi:hypothetical protein